MRIHRIAAENLASLYGTHELDLDRDLAGAGLFLIHGPTGAGKSTLLDAVMLALFGRTPRLGSANSSPVDDLDDVDARQIMSRGTATSSARCWFSRLEQGRRRYFEAVWTARRARGRADGKLQSTTRGIHETNAQWQRLAPADGVIGAESDKAKLYAAAFSEALDDLSYEDFTRCVLLAQGAFAELMKSGGTDRARILSRISDSSRYREIGKRAAEAFSRANGEVRDLTQRIGGRPLWSDQQWEEHRQLEADADVRLAAANEHARSASEACTWVELRVKREAEAASATLALREAEANDALLVADRERLALVEAFAEPLARLAELDAEEATLAELHPRLKAATGTLHEAAAEKTSRDEAASQARDRAAKAAQELEAQRPAIAAARSAHGKARELSLAAELAGPKARESRERSTDAARELDRRVEALKRAEHQSGEATKKATATAPWLERIDLCEDLDSDATAWATARLRLEGAQKAARQAEERRRNAEAALQQAEQAEQRHTKQSEPRRDDANEADVALNAALDDARAELGLPGLDADSAPRELSDARTQAEDSARHWDRVATQATLLLDAARELEAQAARVAEAESLVARASDALDLANAAQAAAEQTCHERRETFEARRRVVELLDQRATLVDTSPCPVCGALEHPWRDRPADADRAAHDEARERLGEAEQRVKQAESAVGTQRVEVARLSSTLDAARLRHTELQGAHARAGDDWQQALRTAQGGRVEPSQPDPAGASEARDAARARAERIGRHLATTTAAASAARTAHKALADATSQLQVLQTTVENCRATLEQATGDLERCSGEVTAAKATEAEARREALRIAAALQPEEPAPPDDLAPEHIRERVQRARVSIDDARAAGRALKAANAELEAAGQELTTSQARREAAEAEARVLEAAHVEAARAADEATREAQKHLAGALPDEVAAGLEQAVSTSREAEAAAATAARVAGERYSQCGRDVALLQGQAAGHEQRRDAARAALGGWLGARGVEESAVRAARLGDGEQRELRERVGASDRAVRAARERTEQASELLGAHLGARPAGWEPGAASAVTLEAAQATREDAHTASRAAAADQARLQEMRRAEEATLADVAELRGDLEARQAELAVWSQINELIGVNGGQRFMEAAQARNLQFLLDAANRQLELLAPRYRFRGLENNGLPTLEFAVLDLELADETRPVSTLSGGETFLCSLALALGLASMRRHRLPIETLLLDEGFGTLDPRSLDQAMQALEALQAGGARVGIISHVGALTERVAARVRVEQSEGGRSRLVVE